MKLFACGLLSVLAGIAIGWMIRTAIPQNIPVAVTKTVAKAITSPVTAVIDCNHRIERREAEIVQRHDEVIRDLTKKHAERTERARVQYDRERERHQRLLRYLSEANEAEDDHPNCVIHRDCLVNRVLDGMRLPTSGGDSTRGSRRYDPRLVAGTMQTN